MFFEPGTPRRVRLRTNLEVYWDEIEWATGLPDTRLKITRLDPDNGRPALSWLLGHRVRPNAGLTGVPDYNRIEGTTQRWRDLVGYYTRFGDVRELLESIDDRYVIMNSGRRDVAALRRAAPAASRLGARFRDRRRRLDQGRRLQLDLLEDRAAAAVSRARTNTRRRPGRLEDEWVYRAASRGLAELSHALRHSRGLPHALRDEDRR